VGTLPRFATKSSRLNIGGVRHSVSHQLIEETVWVREHGDEPVVVHVGKNGPREFARHRLSTPGRPQILDEHYLPRPEGAIARMPRPMCEQEETFLGFSEGARWWLAAPAPVPDVWSYDFFETRTHDGKQVRILAMTDEYTRECLAIRAGR